MKKFLLLIFMLMLIGGLRPTMAQDRTVSGTVTSAEDGSTLPGVNVVLKGTSNGTVTDVEGNYTLTVPSTGGTLIFSFVGLSTIEMPIGSQTQIDVTMSSDVQQLSEVVVTALGIEREARSLGYATQEVGGETLAEVQAPDPVAGLSGKVAGMQVSTAGGNIGGSTLVRVRGVNSISQNNNPLYVVDGTPISNANFNSGNTQVGSGGRDYGNLTQDLNPEDIESINVLKGPAASALYGARGANGVIMITTKKGSARKGLGIEFNANVTVDNVYITPDYQNEYGGGYSQDWTTFAFDPAIHPAEWASFDGHRLVEYFADESWGPKMDGTEVRHWDSWIEGDESFGELRPFSPNEDNIRDFFETGVTQNYNIAINGGGEAGNFRLSTGYLNQNGTMPNSEREVFNMGLNTNIKLHDKLSAVASINYVNTRVKGRPMTGYDFSNGKNVVTSFNQWFQRQLDMRRLEEKYKSPAGLPQSWNITSATNSKPLYWDNPYWIVNESYTEDFRDRVYGNIGMIYEINDNWSVSGFARTDFYTFTVEDRTATYSLATDFYEERVRQGSESNYEFNVAWKKDVTDKLYISANFQANKRINNFKHNGGVTQGGLNVPNWFNLNASNDRPVLTDTYSKKVVNSLTGFGTFGWNDILYLDWSLRNDWTTTLPEGDNAYLYPSFSSSFVFSEMLESSVISFGKLRAGWAKVGNDTQPYTLFNVYSNENPVGDNPAFVVPNRLNNETLKPEQIRSWEIGLAMDFFNSRVGFDVTYYDKVSTDLILPLSVSGTSGFTSAWVNAGEMTNQGWELVLTATPVRVGKFNWDITANWATNKNEVVDLAEGQTNFLLGSWGPSVNARVGEPYGTIVTDGFSYDENGNREVFVDGDGNTLYVRETNKIVGNVLPDYIGGVANTFTYGNLSFYALVDFQKGGDLYSVSNRYGEYSGLMGSTVGTNDNGMSIRDPLAEGGGVKVVGVDENGNPVEGYANAPDYFKHLRTRRENYVYDASWVKLREVSIGYTLPASIMDKLPFQSAKISLVGRNLWLIHSNAPNIDPEAVLGSGNIQGFENGQIPSFRSVGFNLNVQF